MNAEYRKDLLLKELERMSNFRFLPKEYDRMDVCMFGGGQ